MQIYHLFMKFITIIFVFVCVFSANSQNINLNHFDKELFSCDFSDKKTAELWPSMNSNDGLIMIQDNKYVIDRKDEFKGYTVFPEYLNFYKNCELQASFILNSDEPAGILFNFNEKENQGYLIEINSNRKFRIKKFLSNGQFEFITGKNEKKSWQSFKILNKENIINDINILVIENNVEIYLNNFFAYSFTSKMQYQCRNFGVYVSPSSKISVDKINLLIHHNDFGKYNNIAGASGFENNSDLNNNSSSQNVRKYLNKIVSLNNELKTMELEIMQTVKKLEMCKDDNSMLNNYISTNLDTELQKKLNKAERELVILKQKQSDLIAENKSLQEFKNFYLNDKNDKDIVNFLYDEIHKIEKENEKLKREIIQLKSKY